MPEVRAISRDVGASPKRLKPIMDLVRGMKVAAALDTLGLLPSPWARVVAKTLRSASANAENNLLMDPEKLVIVKLVADQALDIQILREAARPNL